MKTVIIYDQLDAALKFIVLDGDYTRFKGVYINSCAAKNKREQAKADRLQEELVELLFDIDTGKSLLSLLDEFPVAIFDEAVVVAVIVAGCLP
jgi:hypothetical protein